MIESHRNPLRNFFPARPWAAMVHLGGYLVVGTAMFALVVAVCRLPPGRRFRAGVPDQDPLVGSGDAARLSPFMGPRRSREEKTFA